MKGTVEYINCINIQRLDYVKQILEDIDRIKYVKMKRSA